jgi:hypothetical protein
MRELPVLVREGAIRPNDTDTAIHALDIDDDPLCGVNPNSTEPWFPAREGSDADVTCDGCREEMANLDEEWEEEEEEEEDEKGSS